ncbi:hypothetical protein C4D60_Mb00t12640 [Musa balbisiana]|uniref:Uncharacterized protein n=1 Tax=Musa balbisiana TaxID=52838 RepID=A0A4S8I2D8_MUSBA|nr:hypothetical protein C4D60_Mb00t12640 [Musa balbisiana]
MKIINSVVLVGLLIMDFLTTFSIGPSYLFLLRLGLWRRNREGGSQQLVFFGTAHDVHIDLLCASALALNAVAYLSLRTERTLRKGRKVRKVRKGKGRK